MVVKQEPEQNSILYNSLYFTSLSLSRSLSHTQTHMQLFHVESSQGSRWYSLNRRVLLLVCVVNLVTSKEVKALLLYYQLSNYKIIWGTCCSEGPWVCFGKAFFFWQSIYLPTIHCSKFPTCFPPSREAPRSPVLMPVQQREWGAVVSERKTKARTSPQTIDKHNKCWTSCVSIHIQNSKRI